MYERRQKNKRPQERQECGATWQHCAPPMRTTRICDGYLNTGYSPVRMCLSDGTHGPAPINAVACPEARDHSPTNTDSGNMGNPRQQDSCLTKRYAWICLFSASLFRVHRFVDMFLISVSMSLSRFSPSARAVATIRCLYNEIVSHRPKYTHVFCPVRGHQIMINTTAH